MLLLPLTVFAIIISSRRVSNGKANSSAKKPRYLNDQSGLWAIDGRLWALDAGECLGTPTQSLFV